MNVASESMFCLHTDTEGLLWAVSNSAIANRLRGESRRGHSTGGKHQMRMVAVPLAMAMLSTPQRTASDLAMSHRTAAGKAAAATPECSWTLSSQKQSGAPMGTTPICQVRFIVGVCICTSPFVTAGWWRSALQADEMVNGKVVSKLSVLHVHAGD